MTDLERCDREIQQLKDNPHWLAAMGHADWYVEKLLIKNELEPKPLLRPARSEDSASLEAGASNSF